MNRLRLAVHPSDSRCARRHEVQQDLPREARCAGVGGGGGAARRPRARQVDRPDGRDAFRCGRTPTSGCGRGGSRRGPRRSTPASSSTSSPPSATRRSTRLHGGRSSARSRIVRSRLDIPRPASTTRGGPWSCDLKVPLTRAFSESGRRESNSRSQLGKLIGTDLGGRLRTRTAGQRGWAVTSERRRSLATAR